MKTKYLYALLLIALFQVQTVSAQAVEQPNLPKFPSVTNPKNLFLSGGPAVPNLWSADVMILIGEDGFYLGVSAYGTYQIIIDDLPPSNIITLNFSGGWSIPGSWRVPWNKLECTGIGAFMGTGLVDRSYGNPPYHFGLYINISTVTVSSKNFDFAIYVRPTLSSTLISQNAPGLTFGSMDQTGVQLNVGGILLLKL